MKNEKTKFNYCVFDPLVEGKILSVYPKLSEIVLPEWADDPNIDAILRFIICLYDPKSPLIRDEPDLNYRKGLAADMVDMDIDIRDSVFGFNYPVDEETQPFIAELVFQYLRRFGKSKEFAAIAAMEFKFWEQIKQILTPISGKNSKEELEAVQKKSLVAQEIETDMKRLETYYRAFYGEEELEKRSKKRISPELVSNFK